MAQHDYNLANQSGADFRADLNDALAAIVTVNSGATSPSTTFAHQLWVDTANSVLKIRNSANDAWITTGVSITADNTFDINGGTVNGITSFSFSTGSTVTSILDEDDLSSDSATALATQQSIKAYVDSQVATVDTLAEILLNGNSTGGTDISLSSSDITGTGNINITGTIQSSGTITGNLTGDVTGNASTATALETARTINGTSFDGTANISFDTDSVSEGSSNLYYTTARFDSAFTSKSTSDLSEGTNLYYTDTRFDTRLATKDTDDLTEGTNLYFTNARVESYLDAGTSTPTFASAVINSSLTGSAVLDDDTFGTASATTVATSESIKAYVDSQVGSVDTLAEILLNGNTTGGTDIEFGDNDKAIFGTDSDLQIYHDGSNSYIAESGTGSLFISGGANVKIQSPSDEDMIIATANGAVTLYHNNAAKLATTSTGIDVTGTVVSDGLTVDGVASIDAGGNNTHTIGRLIIDYAGSGNPKLMSEGGDQISIDADLNIVGGEVIKATSQPSHFNFKQARTGYDIAFYTSPTANNTFVKALEIDGNGDISFYDDTGTTQGLFWDASAERLGIGTTSPATKLSVDGGIIRVLDGSNITFYEEDKIHSYATSGYVIDGREGLTLETTTADTDIILNPTGSVGIGTTSPSSKLEIYSSLVTDAYLTQTNGTTAQTLELGNAYSLYTGGNGSDSAIASNLTLAFATNNTERMRITSSGELLLNKTSASVGTDGVQLRPSSYSGFSATSTTALFVNRNTTDGDVVEIGKNGVKIGSIGTYSGGLVIGNGDTGLRMQDSINAIYPFNTTTGANRDDAIDLGASSVRFTDIYATNGTIQTSDINEKQDIEDLSDAETRVALAAKGLLKKYRWKSAVADKGDDARIHFGIIAQDLQNAFANEGLDAGDYGMFISSTWTDEATGEEKTRLGVRYNELLAFIIAAI